MNQALKNSELSVFAEQLAMILHSGISALEGISIMRDDMPENEGRKILEKIYDSLLMTGDLADSLKQTEVFPDYFIKMTEIGERSGTLEEVMDSLAQYYDRQDSLMRSIRDSLTYPLIMLGMLFAVLIVLMTQVMPVFAEVFEQLGIEITGISNAVFRAGTILQKISIVLLVLVLLAAVAAFVALRQEKGRVLLQQLISKLPLGRKVQELLACARFTDAMGLALHSGLDMGESFELAAGLTVQETFRVKADAAEAKMLEGMDLPASLKEAGILTGMNARLLSIAFHTGSAETALRKISSECQTEADERIQAAVSALEPVMTVILSVLTGIILISVMLPLLGVMANIG